MTYNELLAAYDRLEEANAKMAEALRILTKTDGSYNNVSNAEVLAARVRMFALAALADVGEKP